jgi:hypothetical protein
MTWVNPDALRLLLVKMTEAKFLAVLAREPQ